MFDRDHAHVLPSGETVEVTDPQGVSHVIPRPYRFQQGLRPDLVALLDARPDICARLYGLGLWGAPVDELDGAIESLLRENAR